MNWHKRSRMKYKIFAEALRSLNKIGELRRLIVWARNKRLAGPLKLYENLLVEEEHKLLKIRIWFPNVARCAQLVHSISKLVSPTPRFMPKGSASFYGKCLR